MDKQLYSHAIGSDGEASLSLKDGKLVLGVGYAVAALLSPIKTDVIEKIKAAVPGHFEDAILDRMYDELVKALS